MNKKKYAGRVVLHNLRVSKREWFGFIPASSDGSRGELRVIAHGAHNHVEIDPAHLFYEVLRLKPHGIYLIHNHPSNDVRPSLYDRVLTNKVQTLSNEFNIQFLGHYIVGPSKVLFFRNAFEDAQEGW